MRSLQQIPYLVQAASPLIYFFPSISIPSLWSPPSFTFSSAPFKFKFRISPSNLLFLTLSARSALNSIPYFHSITISGTNKQVMKESIVNVHPMTHRTSQNHQYFWLGLGEKSSWRSDLPAPIALMIGSIMAVPAAPSKHRNKLFAAVALADFPGYKSTRRVLTLLKMNVTEIPTVRSGGKRWRFFSTWRRRARRRKRSYWRIDRWEEQQGIRRNLESTHKWYMRWYK